MEQEIPFAAETRVLFELQDEMPQGMLHLRQTFKCSNNWIGLSFIPKKERLQRKLCQRIANVVVRSKADQKLSHHKRCNVLYSYVQIACVETIPVKKAIVIANRLPCRVDSNF